MKSTAKTKELKKTVKTLSRQITSLQSVLFEILFNMEYFKEKNVRIKNKKEYLRNLTQKANMLEEILATRELELIIFRHRLFRKRNS
ncbi:MAG: hypothetical protein RI935_146 [Candidatus Parcubacteria bacterium]